MRKSCAYSTLIIISDRTEKVNPVSTISILIAERTALHTQTIHLHNVQVIVIEVVQEVESL